MEQFRPNVVLISSATPLWYADSISRSRASSFHPLTLCTDSAPVQPWEGELAVKPAREFNNRAGRLKLLSLKTTSTGQVITSAAVAQVAVNDYEQESLYGEELTLGASFNLDTMPAACASIAPLMSQAWRVLAPRGAGPLVAHVEYMHLRSLLMIPSSLRSALGVLPSSLSSTKESPLFRILDKTASPLGRNLLKRWLAFPSTDKSLVTARFEAVEVLVSRNSQADVSLLRSQLKSMVNMPSLLTGTLKEGYVPLPTWKKLHAFCCMAAEARLALEPLAPKAPLLASVCSRYAPVQAIRTDTVI